MNKMARRTNSLAEQVALGALTVADSAPSSSHANSSTAGVESPARLVRLSSVADTTSEADATGDSTTATASAAHDLSLPAGWQKVMHDSGLPCYVHEQQRLVSWSKPYVLDLLCSSGEFVKVAQQHVPPLSLFKASSGVITTTQEKANGVPVHETSERSNVSDEHAIDEEESSV